MAIEGGCQCGAVRYAVAADKPVGTRLCWCRGCQYRAAGNATVNAIFKSENVTSTGDISWHEGEADSGNHMRRGFCDRCGTQIFSQSSGSAHLMVVRVGTLDNPAIGAPASIIWTESAPAWAQLDPALPHHPRGPESAPVNR